MYNEIFELNYKTTIGERPIVFYEDDDDEQFADCPLL